jgi:hypothetical protein
LGIDEADVFAQKCAGVGLLAVMFLMQVVVDLDVALSKNLETLAKRRRAINLKKNCSCL